MAMSRLKIALTGLVGAIAMIGASVSQANWGVNLRTPVTPVGADILNLHNLIVMICAIIFVGVFSVMFYSLYAHRKSKGHVPAKFSHSTSLEIVWSVIPFLILVGMAIPSTMTLIKMEDTSNADLTVKVTGYQWKWGYDYVGEDVSFYSNLATPRAQIEGKEAKGEHYLLEVDKPLVLPTNTKIRFLVTANDVIHSWWIPEFGVKKDAIPGYINGIWTYIEKPGTYRGQCAELCGKDHGFMPIVVEAKSPEDFKSWLAAQKKQAAAETDAHKRQWAKAELMAKGESVYKTCATCHGSSGEGVPDLFPPISGSGVVKGPIREHLDLVMNGRKDTKMQAFAQQLSDLEIAAVVTYQRNALGNEVGDSVQPSQVHALR